MKTEILIPDGYKQDAKGNLVPLKNIKEFDVARDDFVNELFYDASRAHDILAKFRERVFADIDAFVALSSERYDVEISKNKTGFTLTSFDGSKKIKFAVCELSEFDESIQAARKLLLEVAEEWKEELATVDGAEDMSNVIHYAFSVDNDGKLSQTRIRALRQWRIKHHKWLKAMDIIDESLKIVGARSYVRFYERIGDEGNKYRLIPLDFAGV